MAAHSEENGNMESAMQTYAGFNRLLKWGAIGFALIVALVIFLIH